ncbi:MAG: hypothetical protein MJB14_10630 [Spirochaetes bacterium]|nr:hypothetical protein [Spirochaetota bacterium]
MFLHCTLPSNICIITKKERVLFAKYCLDCTHSVISHLKYSQFLNRSIIYDKEKDNGKGFLKNPQVQEIENLPEEKSIIKKTIIQKIKRKRKKNHEQVLVDESRPDLKEEQPDAEDRVEEEKISDTHQPKTEQKFYLKKAEQNESKVENEIEKKKENYKEWDIELTTDNLIRKIEIYSNNIDYFYSSFIIRYTANMEKLIPLISEIDLSKTKYGYYLDNILNWLVNNPFTELKMSTILPENVEKDFHQIITFLNSNIDDLFIKKEIYPIEEIEDKE